MDPFTIAAIGSAGLQLGSSIFSGISGMNEAKRQERLLKQQQARQEAWYKNQSNQDPLERSYNKAILTKLDDTLKRKTKALEGQAVTGGLSSEAVAAQKASNNQLISDVSTDIINNNQERKDKLDNQYMQLQDQNTAMQMNLSQQRQDNIAKALSGLSASTSALSTLAVPKTK